jgi:hypothetical protein
VATGETKRKWEAENLVRINLSLNRSNDADILDAVDKALGSSEESRGAVLKRWIRAGMELDKQANK